MKPTKEQLKIEYQSQYEIINKKLQKALEIKNDLEQDKVITELLNEKNTLTMKLLSLR